MHIVQKILGFYSYQEICARFKDYEKCFFKIGNKTIALLGSSTVPSIVYVNDRRKVPIYKQAMQLQMGKVPLQYECRMSSYKTYEITDIQRYRYEIYMKEN